MKLRNVSASQVQTFRRCNRKWHWEKIKGHSSESTPAQRRGTAIHFGLETYLFTGKTVEAVQVNVESGDATKKTSFEKQTEGPRDDGTEWWNVARFVNAAKEYLPKPRSQGGPEVLLEEYFQLPTLDGHGPVWKGLIDLLEEIPRVTDYKSTSDIRRYAKRPVDLDTDPQAVSYAKFVLKFEKTVDAVPVRWLYLETKNKIKVNTLEVKRKLTREHVEAEWAKLEEDVEKMVSLAKEEDTLKLEPNPEACSDYGGCPHRARCGFTALSGLFDKKEKKGNTMGFLDKLKEKQAAQAEGKKAEAKGAQTKGAEGVLPPDAPSRETSDEEYEELTSKKKKAPAKKKKAPAKKKKAEVKPKKVQASLPEGDGFVLFVDCMPVKGGEPYQNFEDWLHPIVTSMNEDCEKELGKPNFWLLPFGDQKAAIAIKIGSAVKDLQTNLVIMSSDPYARDVLPLLAPHAKMVVRALRG